MEFVTAARRAELDVDDDDIIEFTIVEVDEDEDGEETRRKVKCRAHKPAEGQVMLLVADMMSRRSDLGTQMAAVVDFLGDVLDDESREYVVARLMTREDPFGIKDLEPIVEHLVEAWGGRPTKQPSDFSPSRKRTGQRSTARTTKSTSSRSRSTGS